MLEASNEAIAFARNESRESLKVDRKLALALIKDIEIVGEAASKVSKNLQNPQIPWPIIVAMRNRLIHAYFEIDFDQIWDTLTDDLPELSSQLDKLLRD